MVGNHLSPKQTSNVPQKTRTEPMLERATASIVRKTLILPRMPVNAPCQFATHSAAWQTRYDSGRIRLSSSCHQTLLHFSYRFVVSSACRTRLFRQNHNIQKVVWVAKVFPQVEDGCVERRLNAAHSPAENIVFCSVQSG
jgi:hypothetical protein